MTDARGFVFRGGGGIVLNAPGEGLLNHDLFLKRPTEPNADVAGAKKIFSDGTFGELRV